MNLQNITLLQLDWMVFFKVFWLNIFFIVLYRGQIVIESGSMAVVEF